MQETCPQCRSLVSWSRNPAWTFMLEACRGNSNYSSLWTMGNPFAFIGSGPVHTFLQWARDQKRAERGVGSFNFVHAFCPIGWQSLSMFNNIHLPYLDTHDHILINSIIELLFVFVCFLFCFSFSFSIWWRGRVIMLGRNIYFYIYMYVYTTPHKTHIWLCWM